MTDFTELAILGSFSALTGIIAVLSVLYFSRSRLKAQLISMIDLYVKNWIKDIQTNPELRKGLVKTLMGDAFQELGLSKDGEMKPLKIGPIRVPEWAARLGLELLSSKRRKIIDVASEKVEEAITNF